jgi:hypothetical protein
MTYYKESKTTDIERGLSYISPVQIQISDLIWVLHLWLIIFSVGVNVSIDSTTLLVTDFMNLKIKSDQSFR